MAGILKAVTKELEPEDPFKILVVDYSYFEPQSSYTEQTLGETLLAICNCFTEFVLFAVLLSANL